MATMTATDPKATVLPLLEGSTWPNATEALALAHSLRVPTTRTEAWKYTRVAKLFSQPYAAPKGDATVTLPTRLPFDTTRIVFVNGHFRADLSEDALLGGAGEVDAQGARFIEERGVEGHGGGAAGGGHGRLRYGGCRIIPQNIPHLKR